MTAPDLYVKQLLHVDGRESAHQLGLPHTAETLKLYHNQGTNFRDVTTEVASVMCTTHGFQFGDFDNDASGFYLGTGTPPYGDILPKSCTQSARREVCRRHRLSGTGELHKGHGVAFADLSNNGYDD